MLPRRRYTGAATSAVTISPDGETLVCGQQRRELDCRHPADGRRRAPGQRADSDRLRAARRHVQRRWLVDVHHQRQERHRSEPAPLVEQHGRHDHPAPYPGGNAAAVAAARASNQYQFQLERASLVSAPVPDAAALRHAHGAGREQQLLRTRDQRRRDRQVMEFLQQAHQARHLRRQGEPHVRSGAGRPDQRRQGRSERWRSSARRSRRTTTTSRPSSSRSTTS